MKVLFLTTNLALGGAESQVVQLALNLRRRSWDVSVISMLAPTAYQDELAEGGVPLLSLDMKPAALNARGVARFATLLREMRPQLLHSHLFHANLLARVARILLPVPALICTSHSLVECSQRSADPRWRERLYRVTNRLSDATVAVCEAGAARLAASKAVSRARLRSIPNGVDTGRFQPDAARRSRLREQLGLGDDFAWLTVGRLMWKKDHSTLLRAFARLRRGVLLIAGAGPLEAKLQDLSKQLSVGARFLGARADVPDLMNACDGFVLSSVIEGMPVVLIEAAACGVPIVSTNAGGAPEVVIDACTGYLAPPSDPEALAEAMGRLMNLPPDVRLQMGRHAREHALERFDWNVVTARWEDLYAELLARARARDLDPAHAGQEAR
jgi:glycosyltransferase involved in cell wall biosynthesis